MLSCILVKLKSRFIFNRILSLAEFLFLSFLIFNFLLGLAEFYTYLVPTDKRYETGFSSDRISSKPYLCICVIMYLCIFSSLVSVFV